MQPLLLQTLIYDLASNLFSVVVLAALGFAVYQFGPRRAEKKWIRTSGLLFYVYFRNVDWRCAKIAEWLGEPRKYDDIDRAYLARQLVKLKADIAGLEMLTDLWADRVAKLPFWYPYSRKVKELLSSASLLSASLNRHVDPLVWLLERPSPESKPDDESAYLRYFAGAPERFWSFRGSAKTLKEFQAPFEEGHLKIRLQSTLSPLLMLLREGAGCDSAGFRDALPGWKPARDHSLVWFSAPAANQAADNGGSP